MLSSIAPVASPPWMPRRAVLVLVLLIGAVVRLWVAIGGHQRPIASDEENRTVKFCILVYLMVWGRYITAPKDEEGDTGAAHLDSVCKDVRDLGGRQVALTTAPDSMAGNSDIVQGVLLLRVDLVWRGVVYT
jgi:hypothetical protein